MLFLAIFPLGEELRASGAGPQSFRRKCLDAGSQRPITERAA